MILYHKDVYLPYAMTHPYSNLRLCLIYTKHAKKEAKDEGIKLPLTTTLNDTQIIEMGIENGKVKKIVYRLTYDDKRDILLAFAIPSWCVKTVWLNDVSDDHTALDRTKYEKG